MNGTCYLVLFICFSCIHTCYFTLLTTKFVFIGMASSGSVTRPPCANREDMPDKWTDAELDKVKDKDMRTPSCWCGDVCKVKVSTDRKKSWTEGRRYFVCPNYAYDRPRPAHAYDVPPVSCSSSNMSSTIESILLMTTFVLYSYLVAASTL